MYTSELSIGTTWPVYGRLEPMKSEFEQISFSEKEVQGTVEHFDAVQLCYLFGSYAKGNPGPLSALDLRGACRSGGSKLPGVRHKSGR